MGAGGASLTHASREGILFSNPALLPWARKIYRWSGYNLGIVLGDDAKNSYAKMQTIVNSKEELSYMERQVQFRELVQKPMHAGVSSALSLLTNNVGISVFGRFEPDIKATYSGPNVNPVLTIGSEAYMGMALSTAAVLTKNFSLGATFKKLRVSEVVIVQDLNNEEILAEIEKVGEYAKKFEFGDGQGLDLGLIFFDQGRYLDYKLALKVDNFGETSFTGEHEPFLQTYAAGFGLTLHGQKILFIFPTILEILQMFIKKSRFFAAILAPN